MTAQELRIGNYIESYETGIIKVYGLNEEIIQFEENESILYLDTKSFNPIPLTEEWIYNFGLRERYCKGEWSWANCKQGKGVWGSYTESYFNKYGEGLSYSGSYPNILYVHQLQNLYFALTREELTLKTE